MFTRLLEQLNKAKISQRGSYIVAFAFLLPLFVFLLGLVMDFGTMYIWHTRLQNTADACALAGAKKMWMDKNYNVYDPDNNDTTEGIPSSDQRMYWICKAVRDVAYLNGEVDVKCWTMENIDAYKEGTINASNNIVPLSVASIYDDNTTAINNDENIVVGVGVYQTPENIWDKYQDKLKTIEIEPGVFIPDPRGADKAIFPVNLKVVKVRINKKIRMPILGMFIKKVSNFPIQDGMCLLMASASARGYCNNSYTNSTVVVEGVRLID